MLGYYYPNGVTIYYSFNNIHYKASYLQQFHTLEWNTKLALKMTKSEASVEELVAMIERGELQLPEMQRRYVWRSTRVRDLLDSLYRNYPSGAILLWETDEDVPLQDFAVQQNRSPYQSRKLLLDGQQRLTSLSAIIRGEEVNVRGRRKPIDILFNLEHPEHLAFVTEVDEDGGDEEEDEDGLTADDTDSSDDELLSRFNMMTFVVGTKKLESLPQWVGVTEVFQSENDVKILRDAGVTSMDDPKYTKYTSRLSRLRSIKKYMYRMDILPRTLSYDEVTEIFVRVNSLGAKLRSSDLALAQITAKWKGSLAEFKAFEKECDDTGFSLELGIILKNLVAFATNQSRFQSVGNLPVEKLHKAWKESVPGLEFAINFLINNVGIKSTSLLSSPFILIIVGYYAAKRKYNLTAKEEKDLRYWILVANTKGRFSRGSSETFLDQDLAAIRDGGKIKDLIDRLRQQAGRLDITPDELEGRNRRSAIFKTMFLAFQQAGAKDWYTNLAIALDHRGNSHKLQFHHIFPKAILKGSFSAREADDIANMAFIGGKTNRQISKKEPAKYFPKILEESGVKAFKLQCVPTNTNLLTVDNYKTFIGARRTLIAKRLNEFIDQE